MSPLTETGWCLHEYNEETRLFCVHDIDIKYCLPEVCDFALDSRQPHLKCTRRNVLSDLLPWIVVTTGWKRRLRRKTVITQHRERITKTVLTDSPICVIDLIFNAIQSWNLLRMKNWSNISVWHTNNSYLVQWQDLLFCMGVTLGLILREEHILGVNLMCVCPCIVAYA